jgi:hypothetical protein
MLAVAFMAGKLASTCGLSLDNFGRRKLAAIPCRVNLCFSKGGVMALISVGQPQPVSVDASLAHLRELRAMNKLMVERIPLMYELRG